MLVKVLKAFPYSPDGHTVVKLAVGAVEDVSDDLLVGLEAAGFIGEATPDDVEAAQPGPVVVQVPVQIPEDWEGLHWFKKRALAAQLAGRAVHTKEDAEAVIRAELTARAG